jgi:hypothetical protein
MGDRELNLEKYRHDLEVVRNTALQTIKDFGMSGVEITFSGDPVSAYDELLDQVSPALERLFRQNREAFMGLLYRIDVDEKKVSALLPDTANTGFGKNLGALVIEREFIKVLTRKLFSNLNG